VADTSNSPGIKFQRCLVSALAQFLTSLLILAMTSDDIVVFVLENSSTTLVSYLSRDAYPFQTSCGTSELIIPNKLPCVGREIGVQITIVEFASDIISQALRKVDIL
jgi:hypothetical protein